MKEIKVNYWCNAGQTEETVYLDIPDNLAEDEEFEYIQKDFLIWLDNNEQVGWEIV